MRAIYTYLLDINARYNAFYFNKVLSITVMTMIKSNSIIDYYRYR